MSQIRITRTQRPACSCRTRIKRAPKQIELLDVAFDLNWAATDQEAVDLERIEWRANTQAARGRRPGSVVERQARALTRCGPNRQFPDNRVLETDLGGR